MSLRAIGFVKSSCRPPAVAGSGRARPAPEIGGSPGTPGGNGPDGGVGLGATIPSGTAQPDQTQLNPMKVAGIVGRHVVDRLTAAQFRGATTWTTAGSR